MGSILVDCHIFMNTYVMYKKSIGKDFQKSNIIQKCF